MTTLVADWNIEELCGYEPKTTFYTDFSIADHFGADAIKDTFNRAFENWKDDVEFITELTMVLNWKIFEHYEKKHDEYAELYDALWRKCDGWCMENLKGADLRYFLRTTD